MTIVSMNTCAPQLGWRPLLDSYLTSVPDAVQEGGRDHFSKLFEEQKKLICDLCEWLVQPCLDFIRHNCRLFITTSPLHLVHSLLNLYTCLLDEVIAGYQGGTSIPQTQVCVDLLLSSLSSLITVTHDPDPLPSLPLHRAYSGYSPSSSSP